MSEDKRMIPAKMRFKKLQSDLRKNPQEGGIVPWLVVLKKTMNLPQDPKGL